MQSVEIIESRESTLARLAMAAAAVARTRDLGEVCAAALDQAALLGGHCVYLHLREDDGSLRLHSSRGMPDGVRSAVQHVPLGAPLLLARAARSREVQVLRSLDELPEELATTRALVELTGAAGVVCVPLLCGLELVGVLGWTVRRRRDADLEHAALEALGTTFALAISRARPREAVEARPVRPLAPRRRPPQAMQLQVLLDHTASPLGLLHADGAVLQLNRRAAALLEAGPHGSEGKPLWSLHGLRDPGVAEALRAAVLRAGQGQPSTVPVALRDEQRRELPFAIDLKPVAERGGRVELILFEGHDLRAAPELERLYGEWLAAVAQELRAPASNLALWLQLLERAAADAPDLDEPAQQARASLARLDRLIGDLLVTSRLDAGRLRPEPHALSLPELFHQLSARPGLSDRVRVTLAPQLPPVRADGALLERVLQALVEQALAAGAPDGMAHLQASGEGELVHVSISTAGPGIAANDLPVLFQRFFRPSGEDLSRGGLALYLARSLIEAQGGRIWAESEPGQTTTFHFTVPAAPLEVVH